jgi:hypothetical protein
MKEKREICLFSTLQMKFVLSFSRVFAEMFFQVLMGKVNKLKAFSYEIFTKKIQN